MKSIKLLSFLLVVSTCQFTLAQVETPDASIWLNPWTSCEVIQNPNPENGESHWIQYDLGLVRNLSKTWVWNVNAPGKMNMGFKSVKVDYSLDGEEWENWGQMTFQKGDGEAVYAGFEGPDLQGISARYILLTPLSNYGDPQCYGISEMKFNLLPNMQEVDDNGGGLCEAPEMYYINAYEFEAFVAWEWDEDVSYLAYVRPQGEEDWEEIEVEEGEFFLEELEPETTYEFYIEVICEDEVLEGEVQNFTTIEEGLCDIIGEIEVSNVSEESAQIEWSYEGPEIEVEVLLETNDEEAEPLVFRSKSTSLLVDGLSPATMYYGVILYPCEGAEWFSEEFEIETGSIVTNNKEVVQQDLEVRVYPNPSDGRFELLLSGKDVGVYTLNILDVNGQVLYRNVHQLHQDESKTLPIDLSQLPSGVYFLNTLNLDSRKTTTKKILITH